MNVQTSAGRQALGYIFQVFRYSLYLLLDNSDRPETKIFIERLDDIEVINADDVYQSFQIKHVKTDLTDRSTDLWRTIRVWSEYLQNNETQSSGLLFTIVTTGKAPSSSIASLLRAKSRNEDEAFKRLLEIAQTSTPSLKKFFVPFRNLSPQMQRLLVESIRVIDGVPDISDISDAIKRKFIAVRPENADELYTDLEGWWLSQIIDHLVNDSQNPITLLALLDKINDINDRLKVRSIDDKFFNLPQPDEDPTWDKRRFVQQLKIIDLPYPLIRHAIHNFYRASYLRDWLVNELHLKELEEYDRQLKEEWITYFYSTSVSDGTDEKKCKQFGQSIYNKIQQDVDIPIHPQFTKKYVTRGSYQVLADQQPPEIGWHPKFEEFFREQSDS